MKKMPSRKNTFINVNDPDVLVFLLTTKAEVETMLGCLALGKMTC